MKLEDYGIDPKTKYHNQRLTFAEYKFVSFMWTDHVGEENKISAVRLAILFAGVMIGIEIMRVPKLMAQWKRNVRHMHNHLLTSHQRIPILSKAGNDGGYWIAETDAEAADFYHTFRKRGMTGLVKASRGKQAVMVEMMQQLSFEFEDLADKTGIEMPKQSKKTTVPVAVVDRFLGKMLEEPEKHAEGLRKISEKYGSVLLPKSHVRQMQAKTDELQKMFSSLAA